LPNLFEIQGTAESGCAEAARFRNSTSKSEHSSRRLGL
jgi:hypothetical protein